MIAPDGNIQTIAGTGFVGFAGDGGPAISGTLSGPSFILPDAPGNLWIADTNHHRVRKISPDGIIRTIAGNGKVGYAGDGGPASAAEFIIPTSLALDASGNLYIADPAANTIRRVDQTGTITTFAGTPGLSGYQGDGGPASSALLHSPFGVAVDADGSVLIADSGNGVTRRVTPDGIISSIQSVGSNPIYGFGPAEALVPDGTGGIYLGITSYGQGSIAYEYPGANPLPPLAPFVPWIGIENAGAFLLDLLDGAVAPGMLATIYGNQLGPATGVTASLGANGGIADKLAGVQVFFGDSAAPVLYAQAGQINVVVPFEVEGLSTVQVHTEYSGLSSNTNTLTVVPAFPELFTQNYGNLIGLNQDGTVNSGSNPAPVGSVISVFGTGGGQTDPPEMDGTLASGPLARLKLPVQAQIEYDNGNGYSTIAAPVLYAGAAPGLLAGVFQVNVQIPPIVPPAISQTRLTISIGGASSVGAYIVIANEN